MRGFLFTFRARPSAKRKQDNSGRLPGRPPAQAEPGQPRLHLPDVTDHDRTVAPAPGEVTAAGAELPPDYWRFFAAWTALGIGAFAAFLAIFYLMVAKPL